MKNRTLLTIVLLGNFATSVYAQVWQDNTIRSRTLEANVTIDPMDLDQTGGRISNHKDESLVVHCKERDVSGDCKVANLLLSTDNRLYVVHSNREGQLNEIKWNPSVLNTGNKLKKQMRESYVDGIQKHRLIKYFGEKTSNLVIGVIGTDSILGYVVLPLALPFTLVIDAALIPANVTYHMANTIKKARLIGLEKKLLSKEQRDITVSNKTFEKLIYLVTDSIQKL